MNKSKFLLRKEFNEFYLKDNPIEKQLKNFIEKRNMMIELALQRFILIKRISLKKIY